MRIRRMYGTLVLGLLLLCFKEDVSAAIPTEVHSKVYTTINVDANDNEDGMLLYAIDSDSPGSFTTNSNFIVEEGSTHIVYVKDEAGNISSQTITAPIEKMGIELTMSTDNLSGKEEFNPYIDPVSSAEVGGGSVYSRVEEPKREFFTIVTKDEHVFYMVVDNNQSSNNIYLLTQVTDQDLMKLAKENKVDVEASKSILDFNNTNATEDSNAVNNQVKRADDKVKAKNNSSSTFVILLVVAIVGGAYYYFKVYKPKKEEEMDLSDALDLEDYEMEEEEVYEHECNYANLEDESKDNEYESRIDDNIQKDVDINNDSLKNKSDDSNDLSYIQSKKSSIYDKELDPLIKKQIDYMYDNYDEEADDDGGYYEG